LRVLFFGLLFEEEMIGERVHVAGYDFCAEIEA
jgi:hypothetical protein